MSISEYTKKISTYSAVGGMSTAAYVSISSICGDLIGITAQVASGIGVACAAAISYFGHKYLSFAANGINQETYKRFCVQLVVSYFINIALVFVITEHYGQPLWLSTSYAMVVIIVINFFVYDNYTFSRK